MRWARTNFKCFSTARAKVAAFGGADKQRSWRDDHDRKGKQANYHD